MTFHKPADSMTTKAASTVNHSELMSAGEGAFRVAHMADALVTALEKFLKIKKEGTSSPNEGKNLTAAQAAKELGTTARDVQARAEHQHTQSVGLGHK